MNRARTWLGTRTAETWITGAVVAGAALFIFAQLHPRLLLLDTTPAGGDMGAHVWGPAFLRDELLPRLRWSGWAPDWYAGFPAYHFYMVVPSLLIVALDVLTPLPYNVAFKLVSVSGLVAMPVAAWAMGRLARLPFPAPAALAAATVPFVFDRSFTIYGGNAASTLAGEFAFSISLALSLVFVGLVLRGLETGRSRAAAAVLLGLTALCHLIPAIFALVAAAVAFVVHATGRWEPDHDRRRTGAVVAGGVVLALAAGLLVTWALAPLVLVLAALAAANEGNRLRSWWLVGAGAVGSLLTAWWTVPFVLRRAYLNDMGWEKVTTYWEVLLPGRIGDAVSRLAGGDATASVPADLTWVITLAVVGAGTALFLRRHVGRFVLLVGLVMAVAVVLAPQGRLWNVRLLPFWYLCLYFLAALAVVEVIAALAVLLARRTGPDGEPVPSRAVLLAGPVVAVLVVLVVVGLPLRTLPFGRTVGEGDTYAWGVGALSISTSDRSFIRDWARWNYSGYERKAAHPEYRDVVSTMSRVGREHGCGRAMWEYERELDRFGTPMALMLLPYWTDGCIGSMEGLYFEASATTPYHFLNQSELSAAPSRAQRDLPYGELDVALGVEHLRLLGVRYYLAFSDAAIAQAEQQDDLTPLATIDVAGDDGGTPAREWRVYEVAGADLVQPLVNEPVVWEGVPEGGHGWLDASVDWYLDRSRWSVMGAADGPTSWQRLAPGEQPVERPVAPAAVSAVSTDTDRISFRVDRTGSPVLVKASYFPSWRADGADGPYRVAPNLMVVVPTSEEVTLRYGTTPVDWLGVLLTLAGIGATVLLARRGRLDLPRRTGPRPTWRRAAGQEQPAEPAYAGATAAPPPP